MNKFSRRRVLRGILDGGAITIALPLLNCFLNDNGTALASGRPLPVRFGTWFWGLGANRAVFTPTKEGRDYDLPEEIASLGPIRDHINVFTKFDVFKDSSPGLSHYTGWVINRSGIAPATQNDKPGETLDVTIANQIGRTTRYKSLTAAANGDIRTTYSYENVNSINAPEISAINLYTRLFGPDFQDPNASTFTPSARVMVRKSALSPVMGDIKAMQQTLGAEDKARLDEYFTGLRHLEQQFDQQLVKPEPIAACKAPSRPEDGKLGADVDLVASRHRQMAALLAMAVACDQTRVFNMAYSDASSTTSKPGYDKTHHTATHEESVDPVLGYQPTVSWFVRRAMESWRDYVEAFAKIKEGDGTLLDNVLIYASTDSGFARIHSYDDVPMFTAGRAGGKMKTGLHVSGGSSPATRLGYTAMKLMGLNSSTWGTRSNQTSKEIGEIVA
jgi:hypothetical protein